MFPTLSRKPMWLNVRIQTLPITVFIPAIDQMTNIDLSIFRGEKNSFSACFNSHLTNLKPTYHHQNALV